MTPAPATMRAIVLDGPGAPAGLQARRAPSPQAGPDEAVVEVIAAAVNRSDLLNVIGLPITTYPRVPGRDFCGTVVEGPAELIGTICWGTGSGDLGFGRDGSHAERLVVPVAALVPRPAAWTAVEAGAAGLSYLVSADGLDRAGLASAGPAAAAGREDPIAPTVLVTGAAGGVGSAASALARWRGARLVAAVADEIERDAVLAAHPEAVVAVAGTDDLPKVVGAATDGRGAEIVFDTVGNAVFADCVASLADGGRMVVITAIPGAEAPLDLFGFYRRSATLTTANSTRRDSAWAGETLRGLLPGFESGELPPPVVAEEFALEDCVDAYRAVQEGRRGRVLLRCADEKGSGR